MKRVLTLHIDETRLTPELVAVLEAVSQQYEKPHIKVRRDGMAVYVDDWKGLI